MTAHTFATPHAVQDCPHTPGECPVCDNSNIGYIERSCSLCGGNSFLETLTTDCSGRHLSRAEVHLVAEGKLDFVNGKWVDGYARPPAPVTQTPPEPVPPVTYTQEERLAIYRAAASIFNTLDLDEPEPEAKYEAEIKAATMMAIALFNRVREATPNA